MKHEIRKMSPGDVEKVAALLERAYGYLTETEGFTEAEREALVRHRGSAESLRAQMETYAFFVLEREAEIKGVVAIEEEEITKLFVDPGEVRRGLGRMLFEVAQRAIVRKGYDRILVGTTGHAIPFYKSMGMFVVERGVAEAGPLKGREITILKKELHILDTTRRLVKRATRVHL